MVDAEFSSLDIDNYIVCLFDLMGQNAFLELCPFVPSEGVSQEFRSQAEKIDNIMKFIESSFKQQIQNGINNKGFLSINQEFTFDTIMEIAYSDPLQDNILFDKLAQQKYHCAADGIFQEEVTDTVRNIRQAVVEMRKSLSVFYPHKSQDFYDALLKAMIKELYQNQKKSISKDISKFNRVEIKMQRFSDTFIFFSKLHNENYDILLSPVLVYLGYLSILVITLLEQKVVLRGSVCYGTGWERTSEARDFYGYALARAHHLENEKAKYPRIIIDEKLYSLFSEVVKNDSSPITKSIAYECLRLCYKDSDGEIALDYLGEYIAQGSYRDSYVSKVASIYSWVTSQKEYFQGSCDEEHEKLFSKYQRLEDYFKSRLQYWKLH